MTSIKSSSSRTRPCIAIFGMGYVGIVTAATFAKRGHEVICVDVMKDRVEMVNRGKCPIFEPGVEKVLKDAVRSFHLKATTDGPGAVREADIIFICVGTPSRIDGSIDLCHVRAVANEIGSGLKNKKGFPVVVMKSTVIPSTCNTVLRPILERASKKKAGKGFGLACNPEFLKEGEALQDSLHPDRIIIGSFDKKSETAITALYKGIHASMVQTDLTTAEMIKYVSNTFLATKVALSNEVANICSAHGIDVYDVMKGVGLDKRIGPLFLRAGVGFGGSCFPKDLKALTKVAEKAKVKLTVLPAVIEQNDLQPLEAVRLLKKELGTLRGKKVAVLGLSFKPDTDDVRETRALPIVEAVIRQGAIVRLYDPNKTASDNFLKLIDPRRKNKRIIQSPDLEKAIRGTDALILQTDAGQFKTLRPRDLKAWMKRPIIIDGRRALDPKTMIKAGLIYRGIGWKNK